MIPEGMTMTAPKARHDRQRPLSGWPVGTTTYKVALVYQDRVMRFDYHMGPACTEGPELGDVLDCLVSDAIGYENAGDWLTWADEFGMEHNRATEQLFGRVGAQTIALRDLLGTTYQAVVYGEAS